MDKQKFLFLFLHSNQKSTEEVLKDSKAMIYVLLQGIDYDIKSVVCNMYGHTTDEYYEYHEVFTKEYFCGKYSIDDLASMVRDCNSFEELQKVCDILMGYMDEYMERIEQMYSR